ncbi:DUF3606 domain-containing protein [Caulobacter sp. UC70_42]|uniref:DUF3606 domain-containing protein n=1 Tax=Caulobacter sp. UC70_42 TaxID=3374551 RepID=UPI0037572144
MVKDVYDDPSHVSAVDGEVTVMGPGPASMSITPGAARDTAKRLEAAAAKADQGHVEAIDQDDPAALQRCADRLGVTPEAVRNAVIAVGPDSEAVAMRLRSARGAAD